MIRKGIVKTDQRHSGLSSWADRIFRGLLRLFPFDFRSDHGRDMELTLRAQHREARREGSLGALVRLWLEVIRDMVTAAPREHIEILRQDVSYGWRALRRAPVFAISAVLTLAIGMSAITGMAAVLNAVMFRPLAVERPEQLVSISNQSRSSDYVSYKDLQDYRAETVLSDAIGYVPPVATLRSSRCALISESACPRPSASCRWPSPICRRPSAIS